MESDRSGFERFRGRPGLARIRTPDAAIRGLLNGAAEPEDLYEAAGRVRPLASKPQDPADLDRALARWSPGKGDLALGRAFKGLLDSSDQETALHAAESMSVMEVRYAKALDTARKNNNQYMQAILYSELAELTGVRETLGIFYLRQAFEALVVLSDRKALNCDSLKLAVKLQLLMGRTKTAIQLAQKALKSYPNDPGLLEALADLKFQVRDYEGLRAVVRRLEEVGALDMGRLSQAARRWL